MVLAHQAGLVFFAKAAEYSTVQNAPLAVEKGSRHVACAMAQAKLIESI